VNEQ
jgi:hypothetical protein